MTMDVRFDRVARALRGDITEDDLVKFPREGDDKLQRRKDIFWAINSLLPSCQRFVGYIEKKRSVRDVGNNKLLELFLDDCDWRANSLTSWLQTFMIGAKARGTMLVLVDMPSTLPEDQGSQVEQRAVPYLVPVTPESVSEYRTNARGRISYIKWDESIWIGEEQVTRTQEWTDTGWIITTGDVISAGEHGLGVCPVLAFTEMDAMPCVGPFAQIADISIRLCNMYSEVDESLRANTFNMLSYHIPESMAGQIDMSNIIEEIGTNNMLRYYGERPGYIAPDSGPLSSYHESITRLVGLIDTISMNVEEPNHQESGVALTLRFQALNSALTGFARRMEDLERNIWDVVCRWLRIENKTEISWAKDYALADLTAEMAILQQAQAAAMPESYIRAKMKQIVQLDLGDMEGVDTAAIMDEIDAMEHSADAGNQG